MIEVRPLTAADVDLGMRLKAAANWNQTEADWRRLLELDPEGCFVGVCDGVPAATLTATLFGDVGWIAMVLTDPAYRGRGLATALLRQALAWLESRGATAARLDATDLGRPVYERLGFRVVAEERRYFGTPITAGAISTILLTAPQLAAAAALDATSTGNDRGRLLTLLHRDWPEAAYAFAEHDRLRGYVVARRGSRAPQIGPCVADGPEVGAALLGDALGRFAGGPVYVDVPTANRPACALVERAGLAVERTFFRMTRGRDVAEREQNVWANFGPELG